jgi:PKD repeat protein
MNNILKYKKISSTSVLMVSVFVLSIFMTSCEFDLPEADSIPDATPPSADFGYSQDAEEYLLYIFSNLSTSATDYSWNFGDGSAASTEFEPVHIFPEADTDTTETGTTYMVTLTVSDKLNAISTYTSEVTVLKPAVPPSIVPTILNGDFSAGADDWRLNNWSVDNENNIYPFNTSSDGSPYNYDGTDSGSSKTPGAKYTSGTSVKNLTDPASIENKSTRYAYQKIKVSPNTQYMLEYQYAIKTDKDDVEGGDRVIVEIVDGWYLSWQEVLESPLPRLAQGVGDIALGKGNFSDSQTIFTTNDSGEVAIWMYAITNDELYVDNIKVTPIE